jgi:hypothetical protein
LNLFAAPDLRFRIVASGKSLGFVEMGSRHFEKENGGGRKLLILNLEIESDEEKKSFGRHL